MSALNGHLPYNSIHDGEGGGVSYSQKAGGPRSRLAAIRGYCLAEKPGKSCVRWGMSHKTKAALPGRQCQSTKLKPTQHSMLADLVNYQPFGSMPRCCSSLRSMRLIQVARDESPSLRISSSSCERNSSLSRIWYCGDFFSSCIDTCNYPSYHLNVTTRVITFELKSNAPECCNTTEASHQTVNRGNDHG